MLCILLLEEWEDAMRFITCTGYFSTGSSAVTDFVSEFDEVCSMSDAEFRFLHDPDGVDDLFFHLVENHNRHNAGHALKRYKKLVDFYSGGFLGRQYEKWFCGNWKRISYSYIDSLAEIKFRGWWAYDLYDRGVVYWFFKRLPNYLLHLTVWRNKPEMVFDTMKGEITYCAKPTQEEFIAKTKKYIYSLFGSYTDKPVVMVDQIVPPSNIWRYTRYFDDIKVVLVDRDPRDIYILEKTKWKDPVIPHEGVEEFCKWFIYTREHRKKERFDRRNVMFLKFEDMVYHYETTSRRLCDFLGLDEKSHTRKGICFKPEVSRNNTRTWIDHPEYAEDIAYIEANLADYLYELSI